MKLDKETFQKQHFWFLLGLFVPLVIVALMWLSSTVEAEVKESTKSYQKAEKRINGPGLKKTKSPKWIDELSKKETLVAEKKKDFWKRAWEAQKEIMTWPPDVENVMKDKYWGDPIESLDRGKYARADQYVVQFEKIKDIIQPMDLDGKGIVQFMEKTDSQDQKKVNVNGWKTILRFLSSWRKLPPSSNEVWLAQEDFWVQRGLLQCIREVNDSVANLRKLDNAPKADSSKGEIDRQVFANSNWELDLTLARDNQRRTVFRPRITNLTSHRLELAVRFLVRVEGGQNAEELNLEGDPLGPSQSLSLRDILTRASSPRMITAVEQVLDWRTAPMKRLDRLELFYPSHRTYLWGELAPAFIENKKEALAKKSDDDDDFVPVKKKDTGPMPMGGSNYKPKPGETYNGLKFNRYIDPDPDIVRRIPFALLLVVEQAHIQDVLTALANSNLRIQVTQWQWERFHESIKPPSDEEKEPMGMGGLFNPGRRPGRYSPSSSSRGMPNMGMGMGMAMGGMGRSLPNSGASSMRSRTSSPGDFGQMMRRSRLLPGFNRSFNFMGALAMGAAAAEDEPTDLVQLEVYGLVSLYNRYPPREVTKPGETTPGGKDPAASPTPANPATAPKTPATTPSNPAAPKTPGTTSAAPTGASSTGKAAPPTPAAEGKPNTTPAPVPVPKKN